MQLEGGIKINNYRTSAIFEHKFWLQVLGDHGRFIRDSLYPSEKEKIKEAKEFVFTFDKYLNAVLEDEINDFSPFSLEIEGVVRNLREYKLSLIRHQLQGKVGIHLPPTFINHMVNELDEYMLVINYLKKGQIPPIFHELHHHMLWLLDASGHAGAITTFKRKGSISFPSTKTSIQRPQWGNSYIRSSVD
jgi:Domain of unknown function (DUF2935)